MLKTNNTCLNKKLCMHKNTHIYKKKITTTICLSEISSLHCASLEFLLRLLALEFFFRFSLLLLLQLCFLAVNTVWAQAEWKVACRFGVFALALLPLGWANASSEQILLLVCLVARTSRHTHIYISTHVCRYVHIYEYLRKIYIFNVETMCIYARVCVCNCMHVLV